MQKESRSITNRGFLLSGCFLAALILSMSALAQKQSSKPGKPSAQSQQDKKGEPEKQSPVKKKDGPSQEPCPTEEGEEEPRVAANSGSGKQAGPWYPSIAPVLYQAPSCAGDFTVALEFAAKGKGTRYYQIVVPANAGLTLVSGAVLNQINSLDFPGDCDVKTLTLTFRLNNSDLQRLRRPSRSFFIQWMKPGGGNNNASLKVGPSVPSGGYQKGKAHLVKIVCP